MVGSILPLILNGVSVRRRGKTILGPVDMLVEGGGITIILGPNGSGKTTLLRTMHGIERLSGGHINWAVAEADARPRQAFVFQTPILLRRTVAGNLTYPLQLARIPKPDIKARVDHWAARIDLTNHVQMQAGRLSGGEKQKLALARALIAEPDVLFLDEPCANLDGPSTRAVEELLLDAKSQGTCIVMATHNLGQARRLASDVAFMLRGNVHETGMALDAFDQPITPEFSAFLKGDIVE